MDKKMSKIICIVGPTASGKTGLSIELAKKIDAEIISADSMQIYKGLDVATAKVTKEEMQGIKHHIIDILEPNQKFSVADFKKMCYGKIYEIRSRGKNVIIVGGTGLYFSAIIDDMSFEEEIQDEEYRKSLYELAERNSKQFIHDMLRKVDPISANEIHPNNLKRVIRALEIYRSSNMTKAEHVKEDRIKRENLENTNYEFVVFGLDIEREILYYRINNRVDMMMVSGIIKEARKVYDMKLSNDHTCMQAIGYKEFFGFFEEKNNLDYSVAKLKQNTRNYAKRQLTWFKRIKNILWVDGLEPVNEIVENILKKID